MLGKLNKKENPMVLDVLDNAQRYFVLNHRFKKAFEFLQRKDLSQLAVGKYPIEGDLIFAIIAKEKGREKTDALLELHQKYIDIQLVLGGEDSMGWKPKLHCQKPNCDYDDSKDLQFFNDKPDSWSTLKAGYFAIFFTEDAHMPLISSGNIHKIIVKVAI